MNDQLTQVSIDPVQVLERMAASGLTNTEMAVILGITQASFENILNSNPDIAEKIEIAKAEGDHKVVQSLYRRAVGYQTREVTQKEGQPVKIVIKEVHPEVAACIFWLKNRDPHNWREIVEMRHSLADRMGQAYDARSRRARLPKK